MRPFATRVKWKRMKCAQNLTGFGAFALFEFLRNREKNTAGTWSALFAHLIETHTR